VDTFYPPGCLKWIPFTRNNRSSRIGAVYNIE